MILDAGCGYLVDHKRRKGIGIDLQRGSCDIVGDIEQLPFRNDAFSLVYARNVLEHINNPMKGLSELRRVMKEEAKISITIPIRHNPCADEISKVIFGFPLRFWMSLRRLKRWKKNRHSSGFLHKNRITIKEIEKFFFISKHEKLFPLHPLTSVLWKIKPSLKKKRICYPFADTHYILGERRTLRGDKKK